MTPNQLSLCLGAIRLVCLTYHVRMEQLESRARPERLVWPRQVAMWLCLEYSGAGLKVIGILFNRCESDVCLALKAVQARLDTDAVARRELQQLATDFETLTQVKTAA